MVVNQRNLNRASGDQPPNATKGKAKGKKKKKKKKGGLSLGELMASGNDSEDFDAPPPSARPSPGGGVAKYVFSSTRHTPEQRLYYLLATRPSPTGMHQQQSGGGGSINADASTAVEGGCHAMVFVETTVVAQELVGVLKSLSLVAFALHDRTPKAQVTEQGVHSLGVVTGCCWAAAIAPRTRETRSFRGLLQQVHVSLEAPLL